MAPRRAVLKASIIFVIQLSNMVLAEGECENPPPGVWRMFKGVDASELDLVPEDLFSSNGYKSTVIGFTCNKNRTWWRDEAEYQLPDQVSEISSKPGGWSESDVEIYKTYKEVRTVMTRRIGGGGNIFKRLFFSASHSIVKMQRVITETNRYISDISACDSSGRVDLEPDFVLTLDTHAKDFLDNIVGEETYESNPQVYQRFIDTFGTHYFSTAHFGGCIRVYTETSTNFFLRFNDEAVRANAEAHFRYIFSAYAGITSGSTKVDSRYSSVSTESVEYYGGSHNPLTSEGINSWHHTVKDDPWLFSGDLTPISSLIPKLDHKKSMETAVAQHLLRQYLSDLRRQLQLLKSKRWNDELLVSLSSRLAEMEDLPLGQLVQENVEQLGKEIELQTEVPDWFIDNTHLCFHYRSENGRINKCNGTALVSNRACSSYGNMKAAYHDNVLGSQSACDLNWALKTTGNYEPWFNSVQICYRWYGEVDSSQCNGKESGTFCAAVNDYTPSYTDRTDSRDGGCYMSWKISLPVSAPEWIQYVKLCFSWSADNDDDQCGPAETNSTTLCAQANEWTPYYLDNTDERTGGCHLAWGLTF